MGKRGARNAYDWWRTVGWPRYNHQVSSLKVILFPDEYGAAELRAEVSAQGFGGFASAWFNLDTLQDFSTSLARYPIDPKSPVLLEAGYWGDDGRKLKEPHISICVKPYNSRGALQVNVQLREPAAGNEPAEHVRSTSTWFIVGYNDLHSFGIAFGKMLDGTAEEAMLTSSEN